ncbi:MAG: NAD(+) synthase [Victivallaceae bacterium]|nr:NAD(+) synthase [Victivallaceae bacterium]
MFGFYRVAAAVPQVKVCDVEFNVAQIAELYRAAVREKAAAVVFPELAVTGYTCGDLFFQSYLFDAALIGLRQLIDVSAGCGTVMIVGIPWRVDSALYNAAAVVQNGRLRGLALKSMLPNYREFYEKRWFRSGVGAIRREVEFDGETVPFGCDLLFGGADDFMFGVEICEDLWCVAPPSSGFARAGAKALFNLSASDELIGKAEYRRNLVAQQSGRCIAAYVLAGAGVGESTAEVVYGGHSLVAVNGRVVAENERFARSGGIICADVDAEALAATRMSESSFNETAEAPDKNLRLVAIDPLPGVEELKYVNVAARPFVPSSHDDRAARCREIFAIQCAGLAKRMEHTDCKTVVIGLSGGLDSTLALLVAVESCRLLDRPLDDILAVTMPGFGTTERTRGNAEILCEQLGVRLRHIDITAACRQHFADIGHDEAVRDVTYENTQARERTQILMDMANKSGGIVIGTGDLSEIALGWSTFNGDHMAMYAVNCSVPKTLIRFVIGDYAEHSGEGLRAVLEDIMDTPVSPELLPADEEGNIVQKTEELLGAYELHDFFLYHFVKHGASPEKLFFLASYAFDGTFDDDTIEDKLRIFLRRFWAAQFKRDTAPNGPKVGSISLSPRGDWRMPSDAVPPDFRR